MTPEGRSRDSVVAGTAITNLSFQPRFSRGAEGNCIYRPVRCWRYILGLIGIQISSSELGSSFLYLSPNNSK